jgi:hypothetical protein
MRTILAIAALIAVSACQSGGGHDPGPPVMHGPPPFQVWTPPPVQPATTQTYLMRGRTMNCTTIGTVVSCY